MAADGGQGRSGREAPDAAMGLAPARRALDFDDRLRDVAARDRVEGGITAREVGDGAQTDEAKPAAEAREDGGSRFGTALASSGHAGKVARGGVRRSDFMCL